MLATHRPSRSPVFQLTTTMERRDASTARINIDTIPAVSTALHAAIVCLVLASLVPACVFVGRRSRLAGLMFAAGLAIRLGAAAFFLAVSYFGWPFMTRLQMGNGFWTLASDAQEYYRLGGLVGARRHPAVAARYAG